MIYTIDCEFIDTLETSELISLALVRQDGAFLYFEFDFDASHLTPWLVVNVLPYLSGEKTPMTLASEKVAGFIGDDRPEFWCYYGAYDWYWFCRIFGGFMSMPQHWPHRFREFAEIQQGVPNVAGDEHNALADARSIMAAMRLRGMVK